jgi:uncharacterized membrane protein YjgN (DUF898 family)
MNAKAGMHDRLADCSNASRPLHYDERRAALSFEVKAAIIAMVVLACVALAQGAIHVMYLVQNGVSRVPWSDIAPERAREIVVIISGVLFLMHVRAAYLLFLGGTVMWIIVETYSGVLEFTELRRTQNPQGDLGLQKLLNILIVGNRVQHLILPVLALVVASRSSVRATLRGGC